MAPGLNRPSIKPGRIKRLSDNKKEDPVTMDGNGLTGRLKIASQKGFDPDRAMWIIVSLLAEAAEADKEKLDRIKCMDKLINSGRHIFELKIKTEEAAAVHRRLEDLELRVEQVVASAAAV
jgi:hypothetical protein